MSVLKTLITRNDSTNYHSWTTDSYSTTFCSCSLSLKIKHFCISWDIFVTYNCLIYTRWDCWYPTFLNTKYRHLCTNFWFFNVKVIQNIVFGWCNTRFWLCKKKKARTVTLSYMKVCRNWNKSHFAPSMQTKF